MRAPGSPPCTLLRRQASCAGFLSSQLHHKCSPHTAFLLLPETRVWARLAQSESCHSRGRALSFYPPFSSPNLFSLWIPKSPSLFLVLSVGRRILLFSPARPPHPQPATTVTSELKYSWKHRPRLVNFMSRFFCPDDLVLVYPKASPPAVPV